MGATASSRGTSFHMDLGRSYLGGNSPRASCLHNGVEKSHYPLGSREP